MKNEKFGYINTKLTEHLTEIGVVEIRILVGQFFALDLCPDHERVHRATYPLLLQAPLGRAAWMAHLHSRGNRRDALLILQRRAGGEPGHVLQPLLRWAAQHSRYLETDLRFAQFFKSSISQFLNSRFPLFAIKSWFLIIYLFFPSYLDHLWIISI